MIITQYYYSALQSNGKEIHIFENKGSKDIELYSMESAGTQRSSLSISMDGKLFYKTYYGTCNTSQETLFGIPIYIPKNSKISIEFHNESLLGSGGVSANFKFLELE